MKLKNFAFRVLVATLGIPLILFTIHKGGYFFLALILIINTLSQYEFYKIAERKSAHPLKTIGLVCGITTTVFIYLRGIEIISWTIFCSALIILLIELFRAKENATLNIATTVLGIIYPTTLFSFLILIREFPKTADTSIRYSDAALWIIIILVTIWICDTAAYFIGSAIGKHKLYRRISPNKSIEGAVAGFIFSIITVYIFYIFYPNILSLTNYLIIGVIIGIFSQIGDLIESIFKRDAGVKDSSAILPGHGGFFDRFDAPTFVAPIIYLYFTLFVF